MAWAWMWVLAWVVSGCCVGGSMGAVRAMRAGWAVEGCGVPSTDEHPPATSGACLPVRLPVWSGPAAHDTLILSTMTTTVQSCLSGLTSPGAQTSIQLSASQPRHSEHPIAKAKAKDRGEQIHRTVDRCRGHHLAAGCRKLNIVHQSILSSPPRETDDICAT